MNETPSVVVVSSFPAHHYRWYYPGVSFLTYAQTYPHRESNDDSLQRAEHVAWVLQVPAVPACKRVLLCVAPS